jgi:uncharacterized membrane protein
VGDVLDRDVANVQPTSRGHIRLQSPDPAQAAQVAPIDKLSVVLVAIFGVIFLGERLSTPNWLGVALIAAGAVLVAYR